MQSLPCCELPQRARTSLMGYWDEATVNSSFCSMLQLSSCTLSTSILPLEGKECICWCKGSCTSVCTWPCCCSVVLWVSIDHGGVCNEPVGHPAHHLASTVHAAVHGCHAAEVNHLQHNTTRNNMCNNVQGEPSTLSLASDAPCMIA